MTVSSARSADDALERVRRENETLYAVIKTVSSSLSLDRVLGAIVDIATGATGCNAAFVYFAEDDQLVLRAASPQYAHLVGTLTWGFDEGLTGWVARTKNPEFIRERALEDPRMKYVPELEEERFQSMVAVPVLARAGDVLGVIVLHTEAPREFDEGVLNFLVHTASLVGGAIENAKLFEETRRRVGALTTLTELSHSLAAATVREDLYEAVTRGARRLLGADACQIWRLDEDQGELVLARSDPPDAPEAMPRPGRADDGLLAAPLTAGTEELGMLVCVSHARRFAADDAGLLGAVANQTAVGLKQAALIERLTAENIVKDMFEALAAGSVETARAKAGDARCDLSRPHLFLHAERAPGRPDGSPWPELVARVQARLERLYPRAFFDARHDGLRVLVPVPSDIPGAELRDAVDQLAREEGLNVGLSDVDRGPAGARRRMREAFDAASIARSLAAEGGAVAYDELGAYRYLVHLEPGNTPHDRYGQAVDALIEYDERRSARL
ncbi:MAG: GAF domain-containing protein, partial [Thermoleophilaceae bacterium]|nr:GAF domain-containing protein [Thermoleophilaceae bacterium]